MMNKMYDDDDFIEIDSPGVYKLSDTYLESLRNELTKMLSDTEPGWKKFEDFYNEHT